MLLALQIIVSIVLIVLVTLQERSSGLSNVFGGGGGGGGSYQTRRGLENITYWATLVVTFIFVALAVINLIY